MPAEARTGITIAVLPLLPRQELARSVTSPLTSRSYAGIKRQRKTITDPLTLISQTSGRWEKSTYRVWSRSADWASAGFFIFGAEWWWWGGALRNPAAPTDGEAIQLTPLRLNRCSDGWACERGCCVELCKISSLIVELLHLLGVGVGVGVGSACSEP